MSQEALCMAMIVEWVEEIAARFCFVDFQDIAAPCLRKKQLVCDYPLCTSER